MIVTSMREFRGNQTKYLDLANRGETVILRSGRKGSFKLVSFTPNVDIKSELVRTGIFFYSSYKSSNCISA